MKLQIFRNTITRHTKQNHDAMGPFTNKLELKLECRVQLLQKPKKLPSEQQTCKKYRETQTRESITLNLITRSRTCFFFSFYILQDDNLRRGK